MIRADQHLKFKVVQDVMMACAEQGLYKVSLIAKPAAR
jgi:biopolymer transport protein ExbD